MEKSRLRNTEVPGCRPVTRFIPNSEIYYDEENGLLKKGMEKMKWRGEEEGRLM